MRNRNNPMNRSHNLWFLSPLLLLTACGADVPTTDATETLLNTTESVRFLGIRVLWTVLIVVFTIYAVRVVTWILETLAERTTTRRLFFKRLIPILRLVIYTAAAYYVMAGVFGVSGNQLIAASAAAGVAIGFASQDILKNIFGGVIILFDQPFQTGDRVQIGDTYGEVVSIGLRSTRIVTPDDNLVAVPNAQIVDSQVSNANAGAPDCQVSTHLYLPGNVDVVRAKQLAFEVASRSSYVYLQKPIVVHVRDEFDQAHITHIIVKAYVIDARMEPMLITDITEGAKDAFLKAGLINATGTAAGFTHPVL